MRRRAYSRGQQGGFLASRASNAVARYVPRQPRSVWMDMPVISALLIPYTETGTGALLTKWVDDDGGSSVGTLWPSANIDIDGNGGVFGSGFATICMGLSFKGQDPIRGSIISQFDQFYIHSVTLKVTPLFGPGAVQTNAPASTMYAAFDGDDDSAPSTLAGVQGRPNAVEQQVNSSLRPLVTTVKPQLAAMVYAGVVTTAYTSRRGWMDQSNQNTAPYYGVKIAISNAFFGPELNPAQAGYRFEAVYRVGLRGLLGN